MSKKQNMITALERKTPEAGSKVPIWELEFHLWDKFCDGRLILGGEFKSLTPDQQDMALNTNTDIFVAVSEKLNFSGILLPGSFWEIAPGHPAYFWLPEEARLEQIRIMKKRSDDLMLITASSGILAMPEAGDFVEFSLKLYDCPQEIDLLAQEKIKQGLNASKQLIDCGLDALCSPSDIADNRGPFFNPEQMERFIWPNLSKWASVVKSNGVYTILHSDGNLTPCLEGIANSGVDALQAIDPVAGMDMKTVKDQVGDRLCLCGNIDCGLILTGTAEQVYEATCELLKTCKGGGGLVLGASNALQEEASQENYLAMIKAWQEHGGY